MVNDPDRDDQEAFKTIIELFDQLNKERSDIINNQSDVIKDFSERIAKFDLNNNDVATNGLVELREYVHKLNKGDLFSGKNAKSSFKAAQQGRTRSRDIESVTGSTLGNNKIL